MEQQAKKKETGEQRQVQPNRTGIPSRMKLEFESRSGLSLDGVRVHYNSPHPQSLNARAYTDGQNIFLGPRQEPCLRHELGHIIQRSRRSVEPTCTVAGCPVNDSPELEREADRLAAAPGPFAGGASPLQAGCIQRLCFRGEEGSWAEVARKLKAGDKIDFRRSLQAAAAAWQRKELENLLRESNEEDWGFPWPGETEAEEITETNETEVGEIAESSETEAGKDTELSEAAKEITDLSEAEAEEVKSLDFEKYYEGINPNLKDKNFWINYESYATGDLTSLSAAVIGNPYHGIAMRWNRIGEYDKDKNLEVLRQFLGGERDEDGIVTDIGLQGIWRESETSDAQKEEGNYYRRETAGLHFFEAQKLWISLAEQQEKTEQGAAGALKKTFATLARAAVGASEENALKTQCLAAVIQMKLWLVVNTPPDNPSLSDSYTQAYNCLDKMVEKTEGAKAAADFLKIAAELHRISMLLRRAKELQGKEESELPNIVTPKIPMKRAFTDGTKLVAIGWNQQRRQALREAWGVESAGGKYPYDTHITEWLVGRGVKVSAHVTNQPVAVLWVRTSGSNGGAHYENDTSFTYLAYKAFDCLNDGYTVFLAGDNKDNKAENLTKRRKKIYNITKFWADDGSGKEQGQRLKNWGGDTRTGQFRLYDYLKRNARSLIHIGAMSGNIEAMALLGHSVEVHANSPADQGVRRMLAYEWHDQETEENNDNISYHFKYSPYEKKHAKAYVALRDRSKTIYEIIRKKTISSGSVEGFDCPYDIFDTTYNPFLENQRGINNQKRQILACLWVDGLIHDRKYEDIWTRLNTVHPAITQDGFRAKYEQATAGIDAVVSYLHTNRSRILSIKDTGGNTCDKLQEQLLNYILIRVAKKK